MAQPILFDEILDAAEQLDPIAQAELVEILRRRLADRERDRILADVEEARREFATGRCKPMTPEEIVREASS